MTIGPAGIDMLTEMICGDEPFIYFPRRSAAYLTKFFRYLDLDYNCTGMGRYRFVKSVLEELNNIPSDTSNMPSREMTNVIEYLLHPEHFTDHEEYSHQPTIETDSLTGHKRYDHQRAIKAVNDCLKRYSLLVVEDKRSNFVRLTPFASTANVDGSLSSRDELYDVFISYASKNQKEAEELYQRLETHGVECFLATKNLLGGDDFAKGIRLGLLKSKEVCILMTPDSLKSEWVLTEWGAAWGLDKRVTPVLLQCSAEQLPDLLKKLQCIDFHKIDVFIEQFKKRRSTV